jgi:hypothetical protein
MSDTNEAGGAARAAANADVRQRLQETARYVATTLPPDTGFVILVFDFCPGGRIEYTSNANRQEVLKAMQEFIDHNRDHPESWATHH